MAQGDMFGDVIKVPSHTEEGVWYEVDTKAKTCTCMAFQKAKGKKPCKHLKGVPGLIQMKEPPITPTVSQAMSALIKTVRLRHVEDSVYWLHYLWSKFPKDRFRLQRRLLIIAAEDNLSVPVMIRMSNWFGSPKRESFPAAVSEIVRICKTENWWAQDTGHEYMKAWFDMEQSGPNPLMGQKFPQLLDVTCAALESGDAATALYAYGAMWGKDAYYDHKAYGKVLYKLSLQLKKLEARQTISVFNTNASLLGRDGNYTGQALYRLAVGRFGRQNSPKVMVDEVTTLIAQAEERWKTPLPMPGYLLDGIHTTGSDRRFAGVVRYMYGCCLAYKKYGKLDPADKWTSDIWRAIK